MEALMLLAQQKETLYREASWNWMSDQVVTIDETRGARLPLPHKEYLKDLTQILDDPDEPLIAIPKSRRMMITWIVSLWCCWYARYHDDSLIFFQSENEEKAAFSVDKRMKFAEDNLLDRWNRRERDEWKTKEGTVGKFSYRHNNSMIWGIPQGGDVIRTYTFTAMVMDESEFQKEGANALTAALPIVENGAKLIILSSSNGPDGILANICAEVGIRSLTDWV